MHENTAFILLLAPVVVRFFLLCSSRSSTTSTLARAQKYIKINAERPQVEPLHNSSQLLAYRVSTCQILDSSSGRTPHVVRDRSASELRAERQSLGDHNSAPQANQTLRLELSGYLQAGEHIWRKKCVSSAPFFPWKSGVSTLHAYAKS